MEKLTNTSWTNSENKKKEYQNSLLLWYDCYRRDLPWRKDPSLYKTVVSEFMLQQTRVSTVLPYFENWLIQFPNFHALANADENSVLKAWEGLGYYSRARNLHKLAQFASSWESPPQSIKEWENLPGVGPYIAAAVTSIAMGQKEAVCDGNVVRVLSRIFAISESFKDGATAQKKIRPIAQSLIRKERPGDYNQAIMELGATICHRSSPLCTSCPILKHCLSGNSDDWMKYPSIIRKTKNSATLNRYWVEKNGRILLFASKAGRLRGVLELPQELPFLDAQKETQSYHLTTRKRTIGNTDYTEKIFKIKLSIPTHKALPDGYKWVKWSQMNEFTLSGPHRKWIKELQKLNDLF